MCMYQLFSLYFSAKKDNMYLIGVVIAIIIVVAVCAAVGCFLRKENCVCNYNSTACTNNSCCFHDKDNTV